MPEQKPENSSDDNLKEKTKTNNRSQQRLLMISVPLAIVAAGLWFWLTSGGSVTTDNAYLKMDMVSISPEVGGKIIEVAVQENQQVKQGDLLFRIDPEPYELEVQQTNAAIDVAQVMVGTMTAEVETSTVDIASAKEDIAFAEVTFQRQAALMERGLTTKANYDEAKYALTLSKEKLHQAQAEEMKARSKLATGKNSEATPQLEMARVQHEQAILNLNRTEIRAPINGRIAQANRLNMGQVMIVGLPVLTIVNTDSSWIEANFKETDLTNMAIGQKAEIHFDAYPNETVKGHVKSIGSGTGSEFSILPAQNATGNWVKVTQRVAVRLSLDEKPSHMMIAGLSATVKVFTDKRN